MIYFCCCWAGTRFRPLSFNTPKPLFPLAGQPMVHHPISACKRVSFLKNKKFPFLFVWLLRKLLKKNPFFMAFWHLFVERINGTFNIGDQSYIRLLNWLVELFGFCCWRRYQIWPRFFWLDFMRSANSHYMYLQYPMSWKCLWGE